MILNNLSLRLVRSKLNLAFAVNAVLSRLELEMVGKLSMQYQQTIAMIS